MADNGSQDSNAAVSEQLLEGVAPKSTMDREPLKHWTAGAVGAGEGERNYKLLARIDRGGMGELFLAEMSSPLAPTQYVVLKRLLAELIDDEKYVAMFRSEAEVMSQLNHPHIVGVIDMPIVDDHRCLAMDYVRGRNVQQILSRCEELGKIIPPQIVLKIMGDVLRGLHYAHEFRLSDGTPLNLVHRDVSPGNVLVSFTGDVKLTDFGIAKSQMSAVSTTVGIVKGKARYLSPEQILGEQATPRSDIFSSACVTLEMLTGKPTFDRGSVPKTLYAIVNGDRPDLETLLSFRAPVLMEVMNRALSVNPTLRMETASDFADGLDGAARMLAPVDPTTVGDYVKDLFKDVEDPLAGIIPGEEPPTVHAYRLEQSGTSANDPDDPQAVPTPIHPRPLADLNAPDQQWTLGSGAPNDAPSADALAAAADSAYSATPSKPGIIRGKPSESPAGPTGEVDEALAVLAYLQSQQRESPAGPTRPPPKAKASSAEVAPTQDLEPRRSRIGSLLVFILGLGAGAAGTLGIQTLGHEEGSKKPPIIAEPTPRKPDPAPPPTVEPYVEPTPAPVVEASEPIAKPKVPPKKPRATIDVVYPRGARVRIDGALVKKRVPFYGYELNNGRHRMVVRRGRYKRDITFEVTPGEKLEMSGKLKRRRQ